MIFLLFPLTGTLNKLLAIHEAKKEFKPSSVNELQVSGRLDPCCIDVLPSHRGCKCISLKSPTASTFKHGLLAFWRISKMAPMATLGSKSQYLYKRSPNCFSFVFQNETACVSLKLQTTILKKVSEREEKKFGVTAAECQLDANYILHSK